MTRTINTERIRELNDSFRKSGRYNCTPAVSNLPQPDQSRLIYKVMRYSNFSEDNDPYHEHDFGNVNLNGVTYFWKIDYYNLTYDGGSEDPSNEEVTQRVLTLMRADEY